MLRVPLAPAGPAEVAGRGSAGAAGACGAGSDAPADAPRDGACVGYGGSGRGGLWPPLFCEGPERSRLNSPGPREG
jgi:hypothetical protein